MLAIIIVLELDVVKKEELYQDILQRFPAEGNEFRLKSYHLIKMSLGLFWASKGGK